MDDLENASQLYQLPQGLKIWLDPAELAERMPAYCDKVQRPTCSDVGRLSFIWVMGFIVN